MYLAWSLKRSKAVNGCQRVVGVMVSTLLACIVTWAGGANAGEREVQCGLRHPQDAAHLSRVERTAQPTCEPHNVTLKTARYAAILACDAVVHVHRAKAICAAWCMR